MKKNRNIKIILCRLCGKEIYGHWNKVWCGDSKKGTGCATIHGKEMDAIYRKTHREQCAKWTRKYHLTEKGKATMRRSKKRYYYSHGKPLTHNPNPLTP